MGERWAEGKEQKSRGREGRPLVIQLTRASEMIRGPLFALRRREDAA